MRTDLVAALFATTVAKDDPRLVEATGELARLPPA